MNRAMFLSILFVLIAGVASAEPLVMYGGDTKTVYEYDLSENCEKAIVNVNSSLKIDSVNGTREYSLKDCSYNKSTSAYSDTWTCNCTNGKFDLILTTLTNAINTYSFDISFYAETEQITTSSSGGTTSFANRMEPSTNEDCVSDWRCAEWSKCQPEGYKTRKCVDINDCQKDLQESRSCEYEQPETEQQEISTTSQEEATDEESSNNRLTGMAIGGDGPFSLTTGLMLIGIILLGSVTGIYYSKRIRK